MRLSNAWHRVTRLEAKGRHLNLTKLKVKTFKYPQCLKVMVKVCAVEINDQCIIKKKEKLQTFMKEWGQNLWVTVDRCLKRKLPNMAAYCIFHESMSVSMGELFMCLGTFIFLFYFHKANKAVPSDTGTSKARPPGMLLLHSQHWNTNTFTYFWWLNIYYRLCCPTAHPCQTQWTIQMGDIL